MLNGFLKGMEFGLMCGGAAIGLAACAMVLLMIVSLGVWLYGLAEGRAEEEDEEDAVEIAEPEEETEEEQ